MKFTQSLAVISLALLTACGKGGGGGSDSLSGNPACLKKLGVVKENAAHEVIIGKNTWISTDKVSDALAKSNARATALVKIPKQYSRCTGYLISDDLLMTNNHCIGNSAEASGVTATFNYVSSGSQTKTYKCDQFVMTNSALDFTIVRCRNNPGSNNSKVVLADFRGDVSDAVYITHQNCDYLRNPGCSPTQKYSEGKLLGSNNSKVEHNADTLGGSSGSPIFDKNSHKVVAIHNAGHNYGPNNGGMNYGVPMFRIVDYIKSKRPDLEISTSQDRLPASISCGL